jgi:hypothetical protein
LLIVTLPWMPTLTTRPWRARPVRSANAPFKVTPILESLTCTVMGGPTTVFITHTPTRKEQTTVWISLLKPYALFLPGSHDPIGSVHSVGDPRTSGAGATEFFLNLLTANGGTFRRPRNRVASPHRRPRSRRILTGFRPEKRIAKKRETRSARLRNARKPETPHCSIIRGD